MRGEWKLTSLREANVVLIDCDHRTPSPSATGYPYIAIPQLNDGRLDLRGVRLITRAHYEDWTRKAKPQQHDVILSRRCNPGETAFVPAGIECALGQNLVLLRADGTTVFPPFLRWLLRGPEWWEQVASFINVGAVFDSLRCADIPNFKLSIPPLEEQRPIARILGALDDKIELNRRMNETLEEMARTLFKSWFIDFDPVRAKMAGNAPARMDAATAALFPASLNGFERPKGWSFRSLYDSATFINGAAYRDFHFTTEKNALPIVKIAELKAGVTRQTKLTNTVLANKYRLGDGDILFSWSGNPDTSIDIFVWYRGPAWLNQHIFKVVPHNQTERVFIFLLLKSLKTTFAEIARNKQTTGLGHVTAQDMKRMVVVAPPGPILDAFNDIAGPIFERWYNNLRESDLLAKLRDLILPRLLSGEMRIPDAERKAEKVA